MRLPSTRMTSVSGSTRAPITSMISPFTSTRPFAIMSSQRRRLPSPACARTFCRRISATRVVVLVGRLGFRCDLSPGVWRVGLLGGGLLGGADQVLAGESAERLLGTYEAFVVHVLELGQVAGDVGQLVEAAEAHPL